MTRKIAAWQKPALWSRGGDLLLMGLRALRMDDGR